MKVKFVKVNKDSRYPPKIKNNKIILATQNNFVIEKHSTRKFNTGFRLYITDIEEEFIIMGLPTPEVAEYGLIFNTVENLNNDKELKVIITNTSTNTLVFQKRTYILELTTCIIKKIEEY